MKVMFLSAACSPHTVRWVNALSERGADVVLVSQRDHREGADAVSKRVKVAYLPFTGSKGYYLNALPLSRLHRKGNFDVVNVHYASGYGTLARMAGLPGVILNVWGSDVYEFPYGSRLKEGILRRNLAYAAQVASTSEVMAGQARKFYRKRRAIAVTPFGVDVQKFKPSGGKDSPGFVFGTVKALQPKYGIDMLVKAFGLFLGQLPADERASVRFEVYGQGEQEGGLKKLVEGRRLQAYVGFGGHIRNDLVPGALSQMDVFLLGSRMESFGVAAVEAMACGLPVIATEVSGFQEVMEEGGTGFLVPVDNAEAMAERMLELYRDESLRRRLGAAGRERVERLYDWDKNVDRMMELYRKARQWADE